MKKVFKTPHPISKIKISPSNLYQRIKAVCTPTAAQSPKKKISKSPKKESVPKPQHDAVEKDG